MKTQPHLSININTWQEFKIIVGERNASRVLETFMEGYAGSTDKEAGVLKQIESTELDMIGLQKRLRGLQNTHRALVRARKKLEKDVLFKRKLQVHEGVKASGGLADVADVT